MIIEGIVPAPSESVKKVEIATWLVKDGDFVDEHQAVAEVDTDKATLELPAVAKGFFFKKVPEGETVSVGEVVYIIDTNPTTVKNHQPILLFISHSSKDSKAAELVIDLIRNALNLSSKAIRCTSLNGYRFDGGVHVDEQLRKEVYEAKILIGLISSNSLESAYVLFELGARWGAKLPLLPLLLSKNGSGLLQGPLSGINSLNCTDFAQVYQFIEQVSDILEIKSESPWVYQEKVSALVKFCESSD